MPRPGGRGYASGEPELVREYSEETQKYIDDELARMMAERYKHVMALLTKHKDLLLYISDQLLEKETMTGKEFEEFVKDVDLENGKVYVNLIKGM